MAGEYEQKQRYRLAAAECLEQASRTDDPQARLALIAMAQKWLDRAISVATGDALLGDLNNEQMRKSG